MSATMRLATQQIRRGPRRVVAIVLAALLSAMAIMATGTFITTMQQGLNVAVAAPYTNADVVIPSGDSEGVVDAVAEVPGIAAIEPSHTMYAQAQAGDRIHNINISSIADDGDLRWMTLTGGQWPVGTGEIAATQDDLDRFGIALGDSIEIFDGTGQSAKVRVVGLVETVGGTVAASTELYAAQDYFSVDDGSSSALVVRLPQGTSAADAIAAINERLVEVYGAEDAPEAVTVDEYTADLIDGLTGGTNALAVMFLLFVLIALLAASMVIRNTFQVLLAQRLRENGLLRLVGATGGQVQRTVLAEALLIGLVGALVGIAVGFGLGGVIAIVADMDGGGLVFPWFWAIAALIVTVGVTVFAAWAPAARLRSLAPIAALSEANAAGAERSRSSVVAWIFGVLITAFGALGLWAASALGNPLVLIGGGVVLAIGLIVLVPLLVRVVMPGIARLLSAFGPVAKLAGENLVRTSRRSGTIVLAISLGGSLILAMLTGVQSVNATLNARLDENYAFDALITARSDESLDAADLAPILESEGLESSALTSAVRLEADLEHPSSLAALLTLPSSTADALEHPLADGEVALSEWDAESLGATDGDTVTLTDASGATVDLTVVTDQLLDTLYNPNTGSTYGAVTESTLAEFDDVTADAGLWLFAADGKISELVDAVSAAQDTNSDLQLLGPIAEQQLYEQIVTLVVAFVLAMLGLTVVISVIGLASVVALAVAERRRELALLRALGMTRARVRTMVLIEAVSLALIGAVFSILIGVPMGISAVPAMIADGGTIAISLPWIGIGAVIGSAIVLGVIAGARPSWIASRIAPAQALARA
ncbi:ABC transporter permease [Gulosibacter sp. ACHW.36C]|uniref:FtsX-like permease family protein n=1 Tax=Gulosibacter sediminis TaxID=1729695 RepID=A0ABY4MXL6_9MICO|nr:FtsX-like permease family protein [Gulosibacter sediminis]UQN14126.1 FtsX-like permease family protein [Gulosibacter sediminis]